MALYQLILAYDGTDFSGFQRQGNSRTVQGIVENALRELGWLEDAILFAGRTDAGVHASGQVIAFSLDWGHSSQKLQDAINAKLPENVAVQSVLKPEAEFHPRYDASSRTYTYTIYQSPSRNPLLNRYAWRIWPALDGRKLQENGAIFIGRHDFSAFGRAMKPGSTTTREVFSSAWMEYDGGWKYVVKANAFLYHMVRRLVYVQVQCARGALTADDLRNGLEHQVKLKPGLAPPYGLTLTNVAYDGNKQGNLEEEIE